MAATKTLLQLRNAVVTGAAIDGQTGTTGRHPSATLDELINRYIESVRSLVRTEGGPQFQALGSITAIPAATANENFIEVDWPTTAEEVTGVDVLTSDSSGANGTEWRGLDDADWDQRRSLIGSLSYPSGGVGWWAVKSMPEAKAATTVTAGTLALFPSTLVGSYRISFIEQWTELSSDTHVWACHADWATWVINAVVMELTKRDTNKKQNYTLAERSFLRAEERIKDASGRAGPGVITPMRKGGEWF